MVDLSTTYSGVVILPQSCSQDAMWSSYHSSSVRRKSSNGGVEASCAVFASCLAITGNPLAVAVGVGRLGVDGARDHVDEGLEEVFLGLEQATQIESDRGIGRQGFDKGDDLGIEDSDVSRRVPRVDELHESDEISLLVGQRHAHQRSAL